MSEKTHHDKLPIRMLHDRVLVRQETGEGERRSGGGILIPATAAVGRRLAWAEVVAVGQNVRTVEPGDRVLFDPEDRAEVEVRGIAYVLMRERDLHAVAADRFEGARTPRGCTCRGWLRGRGHTRRRPLDVTAPCRRAPELPCPDGDMTWSEGWGASGACAVPRTLNGTERHEKAKCPFWGGRGEIGDTRGF